MTPKLFKLLLQQVGGKLQRDPLKKPISPAQRLLVTLHYLAEGCSMKEISRGHYLGRSTVSTIIGDTTNVLWEVLASKVLRVPSVQESEKVAHGYNKLNLSNCVGSIDGKHICIQAPKNSGSVFFNKKKISIVLMACCDAYYRFTLEDIGAAGGNHDGAVFSTSGFGHAIMSKKLNLPPPTVLPKTNTLFPFYFCADAAFPLHENIMRPYPGENWPIEKRIFNYRLSRGRRTIENAFGILAYRWRILRKPIIAEVKTCESIVQATVVLHNFVQRSEMEIPIGERKYFSARYTDLCNGGSLRNGNHFMSVGRVVFNNSKEKTREQRETLYRYFMAEGSVPWQLEVVERGCVPEGFIKISVFEMTT